LFAIMSIMMTVILVMIWHEGSWRRNVAQNTKRLILASDSIVVTAAGGRKPRKEDVTFRVTEQAFREQLAGGIEFGDLYPRLETRTIGNHLLLEFYESGTRTLLLHLLHQPSDLSDDRWTLVVYVHDYVSQRETTIYSTERLYRLVEAKVLQK
jgi:hypothetical protein